MSDSLESAIPPHASAASLRMVCDFMCLWRLCEQARCRRARRCRGAPRICLGRLSPLVPEEARAFIAGLYELKAEGVPFDQIGLRLWEEEAALKNWLAALAAATGRPRAGQEESP
jgi:hypothetical protein